MQDVVDDEMGRGAYTRFINRDMIKKIYLMIFPYRLWNDDYLNACYDIRKEIKNWCNREDLRIPLLMIGRLIGLTYDQNMSIPEICIQIQDNIMDICLTEDVTEQSGSLVISYKTNQPPRVDTYSLCQEFFKDAQYNYPTILALYEILPVDISFKLDDIAQIKGKYNVYHTDRPMERVTINEDRINDNNYEKLLEELRNSNLTYEYVRDNINYYNTFPTYQNIMFLIYLHELFVEKKLSPLVRLEDLCSNPDVLKFSEWLAKK
jgi:hypothetical protein